ncbi:MAG: hypothetical protein H0M93_02605 [Methanophagales archaeon]|nr:hypothetical protein [Methanophagales archaeon]
MAESAITLSIITIACIICATVLVSAMYPAMNRAVSSAVSTSVLLGERIETSVAIIAATNQSSYGFFWVKNIGSTQLAPSQIEHSDIFFGETDNFRRFSYGSVAPSWNYSIENDNNRNGRWDFGETIKITINTSREITRGDYYFKIVLYNAVSDEYKFSI